MIDFEKKLKKYADVAVRVGINIQKDQILVINAPIETADFVRLAAESAYEAGAKDVYIEWRDDIVSLLRFTHVSEETLQEVNMWKVKGFEEFAEKGAAFLSVAASDPELLKDIDPKRIAMAQKANSKAMEKFREYTQKGDVSWCVVSTPTKSWAKKVFELENSEENVEKLWESIFNVCRMNEVDPVKSWEDHNKILKEKIDYMNEKQFDRLIFKAKGTDITLGMPENHVWVGGALKNNDGVEFIPNIPTEEIFSTPHKNRVDGIVSSTKPLVYGGNKIENFSLTFKEGKVVEVKAEKGQQILQDLVNTDEGASMIGEVALVPHNSPISNSNILFYNTLFDENASCHFAIGSSYPICIKNGQKMNKEDFQNAGGNVRLTHVDFMIGSKDMTIEGITKSGESIFIFKNGNWNI